jgi:hypothetical protein
VGGLLSLSYVLGAAALFFDLPSSDFLARAFSGGKAWCERTLAMPEAYDRPLPPVRVESADGSAQAFAGFTLYTTDRASHARLMDMRGEVVHEWTAPFRRVWPKPPHVQNPVDDAQVYFAGCHLFPNGDLLAVLQAYGDTPYGYGLVRLDRDSNVLWRYADNVHHQVDVGADGTVYALTHRIVDAGQLPVGLEYIPTPCLIDELVLLDGSTGAEKKRIPILDAFQHSPFAVHLASIGRPARADLAAGGLPGWAAADEKGDVMHTNAVEVLTTERAARFPQFKAGQVLISLRQLNTLAVLDPERATVVWAARGPWRGQHDPHFLDNGRLLLFDNIGSPQGSRVLEFDPATDAVPWSYQSEGSRPFVSPVFGMSQRLPNANTLIVNSERGQLLEVTPGKRLVWRCSCGVHVPFARRFAPDQVPFLGTHGRGPF